MMHDILCYDCACTLGQSSKEGMKELCTGCAVKRQYRFMKKQGLTHNLDGLTPEIKAAVDKEPVPEPIVPKDEQEALRFKIKEKLEATLQREPLLHEIINAENSQSLRMEIMHDEMAQTLAEVKSVIN